MCAKMSKKETKGTNHHCHSPLRSCYQLRSPPQDYISFENANHYKTRLNRATCCDLFEPDAAPKCLLCYETHQWNRPLLDATHSKVKVKVGQKQGGPFRLSHHVLSCCIRCIHKPTNLYTANQPIHSQPTDQPMKTQTNQPLHNKPSNRPTHTCVSSC